MDTARLWPLTLSILIIQSIFLYISSAAFPFAIFFIPVYWVLVWDLRKQADYVRMFVPVLILNIAENLFIFISGIFLLVTLLLGLVILANLMVVGKERRYFNRTVLSMNDIDKKKARIALKSGKVQDIAQVAQYTDWKTVS